MTYNDYDAPWTDGGRANLAAAVREARTRALAAARLWSQLLGDLDGLESCPETDARFKAAGEAGADAGSYRTVVYLALVHAHR